MGNRAYSVNLTEEKVTWLWSRNGSRCVKSFINSPNTRPNFAISDISSSSSSGLNGRGDAINPTLRTGEEPDRPGKPENRAAEKSDEGGVGAGWLYRALVTCD